MAEMLTKVKQKQEGRTGTAKQKGKRPFNKKGKRPAPPKIKRGEPIFLYLCHCHQERAKKVPCERTAADRADRKFSMSPLGTWQCSLTGRKCKVTRQRNTPKQEISENV